MSERFNAKQFLLEMNCKHSAFFEIRSESKIIAYLKLNWKDAQTESFDNSLEIERIYVSSKFHGKGVAQHLIQHTLDFAKAKKLDYIWLGVWEHNHQAIRFYQKCGFTKTGEHEFTLGSETQTDYVMTLRTHKS